MMRAVGGTEQELGPIAGDRFEIIRMLGKGGMGVVYEAFDRERETPVALKTLAGVSPERLFSLKREFRAVADLRHPNLVALHELFGDERGCFLSMELLRGQDILRYVRGSLARGGPAGAVAAPPILTTIGRLAAPELITATAVSASVAPGSMEPETSGLIIPRAGELGRFADHCDPQRLRRAFAGLTEGLRVLHAAGIVHRDLKPSNVMVTEDERVVLMDFGIAARRDHADTGPLLTGTPLFMAPEQARGEEVSAATDWYSLGVLLYLAMSNCYPLAGPAAAVIRARCSAEVPVPTAFPEDVPDDLRALCTALLDPAPARRPEAAGVLAALHQSAAAETVDEDISDLGFVGREDHLAALHQAFQRSRHTSQLVQVRGASGIGKSALVRRFLDELAAVEPAPLRLRGRAHERETIPHKGVDGAIDELSAALLGAGLAGLRRPADAHLLVRLFPVLARWLGDTGAAGPTEAGDPNRARSRAIAALRQLLASIAAVRPVVLWIDDLQWADRDSIEVLQGLLEQDPGAAGLLILLSRRTEESPIDQSMQELERGLPPDRHLSLELTPLSRDEQRALARLVGARQGDGAWITGAEWLTGSEGNPLFLIELALLAGRHAGRLRTGWQPTFEDALVERVGELTPTARRLLLLMAIAGEPTPLGVLAELAGVRGEAREDALLALGRARLSRMSRRGGERWFDTYHDRVREVLTARTDPAELATTHRALAEALRRSGAVADDRLARHYLASGERERAVHHYREAARRAERTLAFDRAATYYGQILAHGQLDGAGRLPLERALGDCLACAGYGQEAAAAYRRAAALTTGAPADDLLRRAGDQLMRAGLIQDGLDQLGDVMRRIGVPIPRSARSAIPRLLWWRLRSRRRSLAVPAGAAVSVPTGTDTALHELDMLMSVAIQVGYIDGIRGAPLLEQLLERALARGEPSRLCVALSAWSIVHGAEGLFDDPRVAAARTAAGQLAETGVDAYARAWSEMAQAYRATFSGDFLSSIPHFERAGRLFGEECVGADFERFTALWAHMNMYTYTGQFARTAAMVEQLLQEGTLYRTVYGRAMVLQNEPNAWRLLRQDRAEEAAEAVASCLTGWPSDGYTIAHWREATSRGLIQLYRGDFAGALHTARHGLRRMQWHLLSRVRVLSGMTCILMGMAAIGCGDRRAAARAARGLRTYLPGFTLPAYHYVQAARAAWRSDRDGVVRELQQVLRVSEAQQILQPTAAGARYRLGQLLGGSAGRELAEAGEGYFAQAGFRAPLRALTIFAPPLPAL
jgi:serine/threonine protein kinase/tetratricopeptide (TPR) repeat protein